jgi:uncharacterized protein (TIGR03083 family)
MSHIDRRDERENNVEDEAMRAFIDTVHDLEPTGPSWCQGWTVHDVTAHVTAAAQERAALVEEHLDGRPSRPTRAWDEREPPLRALPAKELRAQLVEQAARFERAAASLPDGAAIPYTGWAMTAELLRRHSNSEASLHRWDLVGDDATSIRLLSQPALTRHAMDAFENLPILLEAQRWAEPQFTSNPVRLRVDGENDVLRTPGTGLSLTAPQDDAPVIVVRPWERLLILWGRVPARLRDPSGTAETVDEVLERLSR